MSRYMLVNPAYQSPSITTQKSRLATRIVSTSSHNLLSLLPPQISRYLTSESQEQWLTYEHAFIASLKASDDETAHACLAKLIARFGADNERIQALQGFYDEAIAQDDDALRVVLARYESILLDKPTNMPTRKRKAALLRSMGKFEDAIKTLVELLDVSPIDTEAWAELADMYSLQGMYEQAVFCLEEVLLQAPNAWNMHALLGETLARWAAVTENATEHARLYNDAMLRFCRSTELCDDYLRGYHGLKTTTDQILTLPSKELDAQRKSTVQRLNELATTKLSLIVRKALSKQAGWTGYDKREIAAAQQLLDQSTLKVQR